MDQNDRNQRDQRNDILAEMLPTLSTQLRYMLGNLHLAAASLVPVEAREMDPALDARAAVLDQSYYQLLRLANNLSAAAQLGKNDAFSLQDRDIVELVREICDRSRLLAEKIGVRLVFSCRREKHICALERDSLEQLMFQLLSNAFKYTPRGGTVTVEVAVADRQVRLSVSDTGCGISPQRMATLFEPCPVEEMPLPPGGAGLGLSLCRRIAQGHGGTIVVESREGKGTQVMVAIPDRQAGNTFVEDRSYDYSGGFNHTLLGLADALPASAFRVRQQD